MGIQIHWHFILEVHHFICSQSILWIINYNDYYLYPSLSFSIPSMLQATPFTLTGSDNLQRFYEIVLLLGIPIITKLN